MKLPMIHSIVSKTMVLALCAVVASACNKEKPTKAVIVIKDEAGVVVSGVTVRLFANPSFPLGDPTRLNKEVVTNPAGRAEFDYSEFYKQGQAGFAVLDILAIKDSLVGEGIIKILEEETNEETVVLLPI